MWSIASRRASPAERPPRHPQGHVGHLTSAQDEALEQLKKLMEEHGLWDRGPSTTHDDATLVRFLRARRWIVQDAAKQFKETQEWRNSIDLDHLYQTIDVDIWDRTRWMVFQWTGRRDRHGHPIYLFDLGAIEVSNVYGCERLLNDSDILGSRRTMPPCTHVPGRTHPDVPVTMVTGIVDVSGFSFKTFWSLYSHAYMLCRLFFGHYPETVSRMFLAGASPVFSIIWNYVRRWIDPVSSAKIVILRPDEVKAALEAVIDSRDIPVKYGGELDFAYGQQPALDPAIDSLLDWEPGFDKFPICPVLWEDTDDGERIACFTCGTKDGQPRRQRVCTMRKMRPGDDDARASVAVVSPAGDKLELAGAEQPQQKLNGHISVIPPAAKENATSE
ncbi:CRAL/TRIO domain-containing protein [Hirsutella rhossiliensis]|uniref:CRAL/TRIO domain-containing protein n=1 Tax=Hirsutella rhossiliensis TaxID=111463 RepID=A0A9P8MVN7_9HYPO|nr:CRAL/TRIO domain-containing protein [Hirsutella rhossiliensis]KAH0961091.1 CRAL/TRIO domain-containing protein [Hirsutella rhossiliensis]